MNNEKFQRTIHVSLIPNFFSCIKEQKKKEDEKKTDWPFELIPLTRISPATE